MIHVHSYFCYREEKTQSITYFIRHLFPCDPHCNEFFVKIKIPWFSRGHPRFDRHFVFLSPFQYRGPYFNLVKTLLSKKKNTRADMLERKDSGDNVQCVEKNNPEWPDTSQKTPGVTRHQSKYTRILLPGPSKEQWRPTPIISLKLWTLFTKAWRTIRDPFLSIKV